jgi:hypothetical protein
MGCERNRVRDRRLIEEKKIERGGVLIKKVK